MTKVLDGNRARMLSEMLGYGPFDKLVKGEFNKELPGDGQPDEREGAEVVL